MEVLKGSGLWSFQRQLTVRQTVRMLAYFLWRQSIAGLASGVIMLRLYFLMYRTTCMEYLPGPLLGYSLLEFLSHQQRSKTAEIFARFSPFV
jgi:hypothetical protein